jgi:hypothetical protein
MILCKEEIHDLYRSHGDVRIPKYRKLQWAGNGASMGQNLYSILVEKPSRKWPLGRLRRWEDDIMTDLRK